MNLHTKEEYQQAMLGLLKPLENKFSEGCARIRLSGSGACYPQAAIEMEAFARPLWGLVPYWAGGGNTDCFKEKYQKGIVAGTNPKHPEYWGECSDTDQRFVEMTPIALGLLMVPDVLWNPLSKEEQINLAKWLYQINDHSLPKCNWYFFRILVNIALCERKCLYSKERLKSDLEFIESCYLGNGWFVDGESCQKDYYCAFAMHYYGMIYSQLATADPELCKRFKAYAKEFSQDFIYWFDDKGAALPFGRSLTYRFAQSAFWSAAVYTDTITSDLGIIKGVINRNLNYWVSQDIFQGDGTLSVGYAYQNLNMAERYNAPGSPYWCCKCFLMLALPDDHSFWKAKELPLPQLDNIRSIKKADMLLQHRNNEVTAYVPAVYSKNVLGHFTEKYAKFAYSTNFAFSVSHSNERLSEAAPDSMLAFLTDEDANVYVRRRSISYQVSLDKIISVWSPMQGITVETIITPCENGHIRCHKIISDKCCKVYDCAFSVAVLSNDNFTNTGDGFIEAGNKWHSCKIEALNGNMTPYLIDANPNTNLLYKSTCIPALFCEISQGQTTIETKITTWINEKQEEI